MPLGWPVVIMRRKREYICKAFTPLTVIVKRCAFVFERLLAPCFIELLMFYCKIH